MPPALQYSNLLSIKVDPVPIVGTGSFKQQGNCIVCLLTKLLNLKIHLQVFSVIKYQRTVKYSERNYDIEKNFISGTIKNLITLT